MISALAFQPPTASYHKVFKPASRDALYFAMHSPGWTVPTLPAKDAEWYRPQRTLSASTGSDMPAVEVGVNGEPLSEIAVGVPPRSLFYGRRQIFTMDFGAPDMPCPRGGGCDAATATCGAGGPDSLQGPQRWQHDWQENAVRMRAEATRADWERARNTWMPGANLHAAQADQGRYASLGARMPPIEKRLSSPDGLQAIRGALRLQAPLRPFVAADADQTQVANINMAPLGMSVPALDLEPLAWSATLDGARDAANARAERWQRAELRAVAGAPGGADAALAQMGTLAGACPERDRELAAQSWAADGRAVGCGASGNCGVWRRQRRAAADAWQRWRD